MFGQRDHPESTGPAVRTRTPRSVAAMGSPERQAEMEYELSVTKERLANAEGEIQMLKAQFGHLYKTVAENNEATTKNNVRLDGLKLTIRATDDHLYEVDKHVMELDGRQSKILANDLPVLSSDSRAHFRRLEQMDKTVEELGRDTQDARDSISDCFESIGEWKVAESCFHCGAPKHRGLPETKTTNAVNTEENNAALGWHVRPKQPTPASSSGPPRR